MAMTTASLADRDTNPTCKLLRLFRRSQTYNLPSSEVTETRPRMSAPHGVDQHADHLLGGEAAGTAAAAAACAGGAGDGHQAVRASQLQARRLGGSVARQEPARAGVAK